jgi:hypothetical protein
LESCLKDANNKLKTIEDRTIVRDSGQCVRSLKKLAPRDGGIFLHITADTPGEQASVVPKPKKGEEETEVGTAAAPAGVEFMDGDAFLYVNGDHVCLCSTGMRDGAVRQFLYDFFDKAELGAHSNRFDLLKVANVNKLKMLHSQGVKQIDLRASLYQATTQYEKRKSQAFGLLRQAARHINAILGAEPGDIDDSLRVSITIKTDERVRKHLKLGATRIEKLAVDVVENEEDIDDYVIETNSGQKIGANEIYVKEVRLIDSLGKSVKRQKAWDELIEFYGSLKKIGALEQ